MEVELEIADSDSGLVLDGRRRAIWDTPLKAIPPARKGGAATLIRMYRYVPRESADGSGASARATDKADDSIVRSGIGSVPLLLGGEVDCVMGMSVQKVLTAAQEGSPNPGLQACIELKTNKVVDNEKSDSIFRKKLLKHWAQSFLLGIPVRPPLCSLTPDGRSGI